MPLSSIQTSKISLTELEIAYCELPGPGQPLLVLHGWAHSKERWLPISTALSGQHRIIIPDLPGFGESRGVKRFPLTLASFTGLTQRFIERLIPKESNLSVMGHSLGAAVALSLAFTRPLLRLVLIAPPVMPIWPGRLARILGPLAPVVFAAGRHVPWLTRLVAASTVSHPRFTDDLMLLDASKPSPTSAVGSLRLLGSLDLRSQLQSVTVQTLVIYGQYDRILNRRQAQFLRQLRNPNVTVQELPDVGHTPFLEAPELFLNSVRNFLNA